MSQTTLIMKNYQKTGILKIKKVVDNKIKKPTILDEVVKKNLARLIKDFTFSLADDLSVSQNRQRIRHKLYHFGSKISLNNEITKLIFSILELICKRITFFEYYKSIQDNKFLLATLNVLLQNVSFIFIF